MNLLGLPFLMVVVAVTTGVLAAVWWLWSRWPGRWGFVGRPFGLVAVLLMGAVLAGTLVNRDFGLYSSFSDVTGDISTPARVHAQAGAAPTGIVIYTKNWQRLGQQAQARGRGLVVRVRFDGATTGITRAGLLYIPAAYFVDRRLPLPVIELFAGHPGRPTNYVKQLHIAAVLDREIGARRMPPVVAALPATYSGRASECVDAVNGEQDATYLTRDVPADLRTMFQIPRGRAYGALGYSEGGFCAVNLALHHPDHYAAAASLSGYFTAGIDTGIGPQSVYRGSRAAVDANSPLWWVSHRHPRGPALFLMAAAGDRASVKEDTGLRLAARHYAPRLPLVVTQLPAGGHNFGTWSQSLPAALDFLAQHLPAPLAPPLHLPLAPLVPVF